MAHPPSRPDGNSYQIAMAVRSLLRSGRHMHAAMGRHLALGETDLNAMDELGITDQPIGPVELGNRLGIRSASATVLVDRLEAAGHLHRERHPSDRRRVTLHTTPTALQSVRETLAPMIESIDGIVSELDEQQQQVVLGFLQDLTAAIVKYAENTTGSVDATQSDRASRTPRDDRQA